MAYKTFQIPARYPEGWEDDLNRFLTSHQVLQVERRFVECGENSYWTFCVDYVAPRVQASTSSSSKRKPKVDYREVLSPEDFEIYAALGRKALGRKGHQGVGSKGTSIVLLTPSEILLASLPMIVQIVRRRGRSHAQTSQR